MTPWNNDFNTLLNELTHQWEEYLIEALERGKQNGFVRTDVNSRQVALMIMSGYWGIRNLGKLDRGKDTYMPYIKEFKNYLNSLQ
jgi:hypothetical protein